MSGQFGVKDDGLTPVSSNEFKIQTQAALSNVDKILKAANMSKNDIIKVTIMVTDMNEWENNYNIYQEWIHDINPPLTYFEITKLYLPNLKIVVDVEAVSSVSITEDGK